MKTAHQTLFTRQCVRERESERVRQRERTDRTRARARERDRDRENARERENMKGFTAAACFFVVASLIEGEKWPLHTVCETDLVKVYYRSCDNSVQDFGFSIYPCHNVESYNMTLALLLRHDINALFLNVNAYIGTLKVYSYTKPICELDYQRFTFCGGRRGEFIYFNGPMTLGIEHFPKGDFLASLELYNEDNFPIGCANLTIIIH